MAVHITAEEANRVLETLVQAQVAAFNAQQRAIEVLNAETVAYVNQTRLDVDKSLPENKTSSEAYVLQEVGALKEQTQTHVGHVPSSASTCPLSSEISPGQWLRALETPQQEA